MNIRISRLIAIFSVLIFLTISSIFIAREGFENLYTKFLLKTIPARALQSMASEAQHLLSYGQVPPFLRYDSILKRGFGHCGTLSSILAQKLNKLGIDHGIIGMQAFNEARHSAVEVRLNNQIYVVDGTLGVVYRGSVVDLIRDPSKAEPLYQSIPENLKVYGGKEFFSKVNLLGLEYFVATLESDLFWVPDYYVKVTKTAKKLSIAWPKDLDVQMILLTFSKDISVQMPSWPSSVKFSRLEPKAVVPITTANEIDIAIKSTDNSDLKEVKVSLLATRTSGEKAISDYSPLASYVVFEGGSVLVDSVELLSSERSLFKMDVGNLSDERGPGRFLFASEYFNEPVNTWGKIFNDKSANYRLSDATIKASNLHSAIEMAPRIVDLEKEREFFLRVCYLNREDKIGKTQVKIYNNKTKVYNVIGTISLANTPRCDSFDVNPEIVAATIGK